MTKKNDYDVIIIGAGISGLVCGCYLAKAGLKVLIAEQHFDPGGYCTSFSRKGYLFDTSVHYIGGVKRGSLAQVIKDLDILTGIEFKQMDPADKIITKDSSVYIRANPQDTIEEFKKSFPDQKNEIVKFFCFVMQESIATLYRKTQDLTLAELMDTFLKSKDIKTSLGILFLGNMGLPPSRISAFASVIFFREFLLDPGYYPKGGMQQFANCLCEKFRILGGEILFNCRVTSIFINEKIVRGVVFGADKKMYSKYVVSAIDATQIFRNLIKEETKEKKSIEKLEVSNSVYGVFLGVKMNLKEIITDQCNIWYTSSNDMESCYKNLSENIRAKKIPMMMISFPSLKNGIESERIKNTIQIFTIASYEGEDFWKKNKKLISDKIIDETKKIIPLIDDNIDVIEAATPHTYCRYTLNEKGAAFGWASTPEQMNSILLPPQTSIENFFLTGHWTITGSGQGGISTVALTGKKTAERVINKSKKIRNK